MSWIDPLLELFDAPRGWFGESDLPPLAIFLASYLLYVLCILILGLLLYTLYQKVAPLIENCAKWSAKTSSIQDIILLEASVNRARVVLRWIGTRILRPTLPNDVHTKSVPAAGEDNLAARLSRFVIRKIWLAYVSLTSLPLLISRVLLSRMGIVILIASLCTAYPNEVRDWVISAGEETENFQPKTDSLLFLATVGATILTITILIAKVFTSEKAIARRAFRRSSNEHVLRQLSTAKTALSELAAELTDQMDDIVRMFEIEKYDASTWHRWATTGSPTQRHSWQVNTDHVECDRSCLGTSPSSNAGTAVVISEELRLRLKNIWNDNLKNYKWDIYRLLSGRTQQSFWNLMACFSKSGDFRSWKLPKENQWRTRRIRWQHEHVLFREPTIEDSKVGRSIAIRPIIDPQKQWLEAELVDMLWNMSELRRDVINVADYIYGLSRNRLVDNLGKATE